MLTFNLDKLSQELWDRIGAMLTARDPAAFASASLNMRDIYNIQSGKACGS